MQIFINDELMMCTRCKTAPHGLY